MRAKLIAGATAAALAGVVALAPSAAATVSTNFCDPHAYTYMVKNYTRNGAEYPLRCGSNTWGFRHLVARGRWNHSFDQWIGETIAIGEDVADLQQDGGSNIFAIFDSNCKELFRVIYNSHAYLGKDVVPQGVITAYTRSASTITTPTDGLQADQQASDGTPDADVSSPNFRTDCYVYQNI